MLIELAVIVQIQMRCYCVVLAHVAPDGYVISIELRALMGTPPVTISLVVYIASTRTYTIIQ